jgi:hypothetical protein
VRENLNSTVRRLYPSGGTKGDPVRRLMLIGVVAVAMLATTAGSASATTWSGSCTFKGTSYFQQPYRITPVYSGWQAFAKGQCTGTLDRAPFSGSADLHIDGSMFNHAMSCEWGLSHSAPATLTFGASPDTVGAPQISLLVDETHLLTEMALRYTGAYNGQGYGSLTYRNNTSQSDLQSCITGPGLTKLNFDLDLHTVRELYG